MFKSIAKCTIPPLLGFVVCVLLLNWVADKSIERNNKIRKDDCDNTRLVFPSAVFNKVCYVELKPGVYMIHGNPNGKSSSRFYTKTEVFKED